MSKIFFTSINAGQWSLMTASGCGLGASGKMYQCLEGKLASLLLTKTETENNTFVSVSVG